MEKSTYSNLQNQNIKKFNFHFKSEINTIFIPNDSYKLNNDFTNIKFSKIDFEYKIKGFNKQLKKYKLENKNYKLLNCKLIRKINKLYLILH